MTDQDGGSELKDMLAVRGIGCLFVLCVCVCVCARACVCVCARARAHKCVEGAARAEGHARGGRDWRLGACAWGWGELD